MMRWPAFLIINFIFLAIIGLVFLYSFLFFPDQHPFGCLFTTLTGKSCSSCGLSRAISCFTHGEWESGISHNVLALPVFLFFLVQLFLRSAIVTAYFWGRIKSPLRLCRLDCSISISLFLLAFLPLILNQFHHG
jgi:hypothetical protein